jgi:hypothetical protein
LTASAAVAQADAATDADAPAEVVAPEAPPAAAPPAPPAAPAASARKFRVLVLQPTANRVDSAIVRAIESLVAVELSRVNAFDVLSGADVKQMVELEGEKQAMGCNEASCLAELAGAMGANLVVFGDVAQLGSLTVVNLNLFDSEKARSRGRVSAQFRSEEELPFRVGRATRELFKRFAKDNDIELPTDDAMTVIEPEPAPQPEPTPEPQPASVGWLPWAVVGGGAAVVVVGGALAGVGMMPYVDYTNATATWENTESAEEYAQAKLDAETAREAYEGYGQALAITGGVVAVVGLAAVGGGVAWALVGGE